MLDGESRLRVPLPAFGLGTAPLGNLFRAAGDEESAQAMEAAWAAGIRYYDTAPHYGLGLSERRLGTALAGREGFLVSTKVGRLLVPSPEAVDQSDDEGFAVPATQRRVWDFSAGGVRRSLEESLDRMGLDRIDIVFLHDPDDHWAEASDTGIGTLVALREEGIIDAIGVGMNQSAMPTEFVRRFDIDLVMLAGRYTLLDQSALDDLLPVAAEHGVCVIAAGVFNSGVLSTPRPAADATYNYAPAPRELLDRASRLADICESHGVDLPTAAIQFPLRHPAICSVVVGSRTAAEVRENAARLAVDIPGALWAEFESSGLVRA